MKKKEIDEKLKELEIKKEEYIIIGMTSLVLQDLLEECDKIELAIEDSFFIELDWPYREGRLIDDYKEKNQFIVTRKNNFEEFVNKKGYHLMKIETALNMMKKDLKKNKKQIEKVELALCLKDNFRYERALHQKGIHRIAGVDEVGRGPLVGPVVAACVVLEENATLEGLTDSKKLSEKKRNAFYKKIKKEALGIGIGVIDEKVIDEINIYEATKLAMKEAIRNCQKKCQIEHVLIDAMPLDIEIPTTSIIKGDLKSKTISAASVIAKVTRDAMLEELDKKYPMYDFKHNKGYPTKKHLEAIKEYGIIKEHRRSYGPVMKYLTQNDYEKKEKN